MTGRHEVPENQAATVELTDGTTVVGELPAEAIVGDVQAVEGAVTATQTVYPWKATARTVFAAVVTLAGFFPLIAAAIGEVPGWLAPIMVGAAAVCGAITRVMAIDGVNQFLARFGLSAQPKDVTRLAAGAVKDDTGD